MKERKRRNLNHQGLHPHQRTSQRSAHLGRWKWRSRKEGIPNLEYLMSENGTEAKSLCSVTGKIGVGRSENQSLLPLQHTLVIRRCKDRKTLKFPRKIYLKCPSVGVKNQKEYLMIKENHNHSLKTFLLLLNPRILCRLLLPSRRLHHSLRLAPQNHLLYLLLLSTSSIHLLPFIPLTLYLPLISQFHLT